MSNEFYRIRHLNQMSPVFIIWFMVLRRKDDQISVRLDAGLRAALEDIKQEYGYTTDSDAIRGLIMLIANKNIIAAEVDGRVRASLRHCIKEEIREYGSTQEYRELVRALVDEILHEEVGE